MKALLFSLALGTIPLMSVSAHAESDGFYEELDPNRPDIEQVIQELVQDYESTTGKTSILQDSPLEALEDLLPSCYRNSCKIWADVDKGAQRLYLYVDGSLSYTWKTSTGKPGYRTPDLDQHPSGPIFDAYTSTKYPGGDYNGLGNMPYAVFVRGGIAIHGTTRGNWGRLGTPASHGCIRLHPDNGFIFNRFVRKYGRAQVWVTVN